MEPILPIIPLHGRRNMLYIMYHPLLPSKRLIIRAQHNPILPRHIHPNPIITKRLRRVEVEYEQRPRTFKDDNLVGFVLQGDVRLGGGEP